MILVAVPLEAVHSLHVVDSVLEFEAAGYPLNKDCIRIRTLFWFKMLLLLSSYSFITCYSF